MGAAYSEKALSIPNPRIGLLSIGEEKSKGNELTRAAHELLSAHVPNFVGNVEGRHLLSDVADVIVTDGFTGNVVLKVAEGLAEHVGSIIRRDLKTHPWMWLGVVTLGPLLKRVKKKMDYAEYGGAPLLGLNHVCVIGHGRSNAQAVSSAVRAAKEAVSGGVLRAIGDRTADDS